MVAMKPDIIPREEKITPEKIVALRHLVFEATRGEWVLSDDNRMIFGGVERYLVVDGSAVRYPVADLTEESPTVNAQLIVELVNNAEQIFTELENARHERDELLDEVESLRTYVNELESELHP